MEGCYFVSGTGQFPHLPGQDLPRVPTDLSAMTSLFRAEMELNPLPPEVQPAEVSIEDVLLKIQAWNHSRGSSEAALVFYHASHGVITGGSYWLCHAGTRQNEDGSWNTETLVDVRRIARSLAGGRIKQLLLILDTCHAAGAVPEVRRIFEQTDAQYAGQQGLKIHLLAACRRREEARDGAFTQAFVQAVNQVGATNPEARYLDLWKVVENTRASLPPGQTVEYVEILDHGGACHRLPNPKFAQPLTRKSAQNGHLAGLESIVAEYSPEGSRDAADLRQRWLWYAWHERGMDSDEIHDRSWWYHARQRAALGLDERVCPLIRLVEGFACLDPFLNARLHAWQEEWNGFRGADLDRSRERGRECHEAYRQWMNDKELEIQVVAEKNGALSVNPVVVRSVPLSAGRVRRERERLPVGEKVSAGRSALHARLMDLTNRSVPVRLLLPNRELAARAGNEPYSKRQSLRQVTPVTVHSAERWCLHVSDDELEARSWKKVRSDLLRKRQAMAPELAVVCEADSQRPWEEPLEDGVPVILVTNRQAGYRPADWQRWPETLRQARSDRVTPDENSFLIFDVPEFMPWNLSGQLFE